MMCMAFLIENALTSVSFDFLEIQPIYEVQGEDPGRGLCADNDFIPRRRTASLGTRLVLS